MPHFVHRRDGITELRATRERTQRQEWYLGAFSTFMLSAGLFISGVIPSGVVGAIALACLAGELGFAVRALLDLRHPPAEIRVLAQERWRTRR